MKPLNNVESNQPKTLSKREEKNAVKIKSRGVLFFQLGLIVTLIAVTLIMEANIGFAKNTPVFDKGTLLEERIVKSYTVEKPKVIEQPVAKLVSKPAKTTPKVIDKVIDVVPNNTKTVDTKPVTVVATPVKVDPTIAIAPSKPEPVAPATSTKNLNEVEFVPVFPGCEGLNSNEERKLCLESKVNLFIQKKFDANRIKGLESQSIQKVYVQFMIDENGKVTKIKARSPNKEIENEGARVISKLPAMQPGRMGDTNVPVTYLVPITFKVQ